jgi:hypothetical protein
MNRLLCKSSSFSSSWLIAAAVLGMGLLLAVGCQKRATLIPNSDPALNRTSQAFADDARARQPFKAALVTGQATEGVARLDYTLEVVQLTNLSGQTWEDVEVWINGKYVVHVPRIEAGRLRTLNFKMFYDGNGKTIPAAHGSQPRVQSVQILQNGAIYTVPLKIAV